MPYKYLITGGAGFIGSHLALSLGASGNEIRILDNFSSSSRTVFETLIAKNELSVEVLDGDIRDRAACHEAVRDIDFVLHHAAMASVQGSIDTPDDCVAINLLGLTNMLLEAAHSGRCERFVFASSSAVYGDQPDLRKLEDSTTDPLSPYATTKLAGEFLCSNFKVSHGLSTVSLRYFNVFGPRQNPNGPYAAVIPRFIEALKAGKSPIVYGDGEQSRDFIAVDDIVQANTKACFADASIVSGAVFNIGSGRAVTLNALIEILGAHSGHSVKPIYVDAKSGDVRHSLADISKATMMLNFFPTVQLEEGLRRMVQ